MNTNKVTAIVSGLIAAEVKDVHQNLLLIGLDSMKTINLIVQLEEEFGIVIDEHELLFENFSTVSRIMDLIGPKINAKELHFTTYDEHL